MVRMVAAMKVPALALALLPVAACGGRALVVGAAPLTTTAPRTGHVTDDCTAQGTFGAAFSRTYALAYSPDGALLAAGVQPPSASEATLRVFRAGDGPLLWAVPAHTGSTYAVAFSPDGKLLASAGETGDGSS